MRKKSIIALFCAAILLSGCGANNVEQENANPGSNSKEENSVSEQKETEDLTADLASYSDMFTERDEKNSYNEASAINITLSAHPRLYPSAKARLPFAGKVPM